MRFQNPIDDEIKMLLCDVLNDVFLDDASKKMFKLLIFANSISTFLY